MPLFKVIPKVKRGQKEEVYCPRCNIPCQSEEFASTVEENGEARRRTEGNHSCPACGWKVTVIESFPMINRAIKG